MRSSTGGGPTLLPHIVATGFTTALLGDERTLREFVVGDHVVRAIRKRGGIAIPYLINDSNDPLNERQLRVAVNKDAALIERFLPFCGRPIAEIPDPFECHVSYSEHFAEALIDRLHALDIHPMLLDSYAAYHDGHYAPFVAATFEHYHEIQKQLEERFDYKLLNLFRIQCPQCRRIDGVEITGVESGVSFRCEFCGLSATDAPGALRGKLNWKLDCAARWNLYGIDTEVFAKAHHAEKGTLNSSRYVSENFFGGRVPEVVKYGDLRISRDLSGRLLSMLPPRALRQLLTDNLETDLDINADYVEHFARGFEVRAGTSFVEYVRKELPRTALQIDHRNGVPAGHGGRPVGASSEEALVEYANAFSEFYYGNRHGLRWPNMQAIKEVNPCTARAALDVVGFAVALRTGSEQSVEEIKHRIKSHLAERPALPDLYPYLRKLLAQDHGPNVTTLLALLPVEYLLVVQSIVMGHAKVSGVSLGENDATGEEAA